MKVAIIPARGGSKRIPGKNIKEFFGKPIIAYSIQAAQSSKLFDRIIVSTDSTEIAEVASLLGAEIPFMRPQELSDDSTHTDPVILHALEWLLEKECNVNYVCCLYPTAPFIKPKYLKQTIHKDYRGNLTEVFLKKKIKFNFNKCITVTSKKNVVRGLHFQKKISSA